MRPTWAEVSLSALRHNFRLIHQHVGPEVTVCAVIKADAYGHGAPECARALQQATGMPVSEATVSSSPPSKLASHAMAAAAMPAAIRIATRRVMAARLAPEPAFGPPAP